MRVFSSSSELEAWQKLWLANSRRGAKIIYDQAADEVRVLVRLDRKISEKAFPVKKSLSAALDEATKFVRERFDRWCRAKNKGKADFSLCFCSRAFPQCRGRLPPVLVCSLGTAFTHAIANAGRFLTKMFFNHG